MPLKLLQFVLYKHNAYPTMLYSVRQQKPDAQNFTSKKS